MGIAGYGVTDNNFRLRFLILVAMGMFAFGAVLYWRYHLMLSTEYVDIPMAKHLTREKNRYELNE